jgi:hypothetical protein
MAMHFAVYMYFIKFERLSMKQDIEGFVSQKHRSKCYPEENYAAIEPTTSELRGAD